MSSEFWMLFGIGVALYVGLVGAVLIVGPRWFEKRYGTRERHLQDLVKRSQETYVDLQAQVNVYREQLRVKEEQNGHLLVQAAQDNSRIEQLTERVQKLQQQVEHLTHQLEASKVIEKPSPKVGAQIRVLLIAPKSDLPLADAEKQDLARSGLSVTPVYSPVNGTVLTREIRASHHDGLWLAGHMDSEGNFLLDGGELLSASALTSLVRGRFRWVFLNTCESAWAAQMVQNETDATVICTLIKEPDIDAYRTGSLFASYVAQTGDLYAAYKQALPGGNRIFVYLGGEYRSAA